MDLLGIVTVLYNSNNVLDDFLKSISIQSWKHYKLYLIDNSVNAETNNLIENLARKYKIINYVHVKNYDNLGIAEGNNIGMRMALEDGCSHICLSNNDIVFEQPNLLEDLILQAQERGPVVLAPKVYMEGQQKNLIWYAGGKYLYNRGAVWHDGYNKIDNGQYDRIREVKFAPACFVIVPKQIIEEVGFMDPQYFVYVDDADYMLRVIRSGFKIIYLPHLHIYHKVSSSTGGVFSSFGLYYNTRNRVYWIRKLFRGPRKYIPLAYIPLQMIYHSFFIGIKGSVSLVLKGYRDGFKMRVQTD